MKIRIKGFPMFFLSAFILGVLKLCGVSIPLGWGWIAFIGLGDILLVGLIIFILSVIDGIRNG